MLRPVITVSPRRELKAGQLWCDQRCLDFKGSLFIRNIAEGEGHGDLQEKTDGSEGIACECCKSEAANYARSVGVKSTLRAIVAKRDEEVDPHAPVVLGYRLV